MPRFTVRDLLLATTLIAAGIGGWCFLAQLDAPVNSGVPLMVAGVFASTCMIGAGIGTLWKKKMWGAAVAVIGVILLSPALMTTIGDGSFTLSVQIVPAPEAPIKSLMGVKTSSREIVDIVLSKPSLSNVDRSPGLTQIPFVNQPLTVDVWQTWRDSWFSHTYIQERWLVLIAEFEDGRRVGKCVDIPDGRTTQTVTVEFP